MSDPTGPSPSLGPLTNECSRPYPVPSALILNTVPLSIGPPAEVMPYNVEPDGIKEPDGMPPSAEGPVNEWRITTCATAALVGKPAAITAKTPKIVGRRGGIGNSPRVHDQPT